MSDPLRTDLARAADALSGVEREARVEQLLLQGLDHYFAGAYESAIHVWTRVLFLDRGHDRARAYIERARGAQAERQRESEELLHQGVAAFDRGETTDARFLLSAAASGGASPEIALSYLERLDRLQTPARRPAVLEPARDRRPPAAASVPASRAAASPWRFYAVTITSVVAVTVAAWAALVLFELADIRAALQRTPAGHAVTPVTIEEPLPVCVRLKSRLPVHGRNSRPVTCSVRSPRSTPSGHSIQHRPKRIGSVPRSSARSVWPRSRARRPERRLAPWGGCHEVPQVLVYRV